MCGIAGILSFDREQAVSEARVRTMCDAITYRGPDSDGFYVNGNVGLGMRRLRIIDLEGGKQPIFNEDGQIALVFNGEIYNYRELRPELEARGHTFRTHSDTETIVHLYEEEGEDCVRKLRGMFAFALWDNRQRKLFIARDRLGKKPLFYVNDGKRFVFGSEIKCITALREHRLDMDVRTLDSYFSLGYIPSPHTIYKQVLQLPAAHTMTIRDGTISTRRYWDVSSVAPSSDTREEVVIEKLTTLLKESVRLRLVSDVPFGAFLSGGVDSSLVVALMSSFMSEPVKTFTIGFEEKSRNEMEFARATARHFKTDHHEMLCRPDAVGLCEKLVDHFDEPYADASAIPTFMVAKFAREKVTMTLSGDGGDELFAGYDHYLKTKQLALLRKVSLGTMPTLLRAGANVAGLVSQPIAARAQWAAYRMNLPEEESLREGVSIFSHDLKTELLAGQVNEQLDGSMVELFRAAFAEGKHFDSINRMLYVDLRTYLVDDILTKVDRMTMANSLESRVPLLDHVLVEYVFSLPSELKLKGMVRKYILKKTAARMLPEEILSRKKMGFGLPLREWFRGPLKAMTRDVLLGPAMSSSGLFERATIERMVVEHEQGTRHHEEHLWALMQFAMWMKKDRARSSS